MSRVHVGKYQVQIDTNKHYNRATVPSLKATITVFLVPR